MVRHCRNLWIFSHKPSNVGLPVCYWCEKAHPMEMHNLKARGDLWKSDPSVCVSKSLCVLGEVVKNSSADQSHGLQFNFIHMTRSRRDFWGREWVGAGVGARPKGNGLPLKNKTGKQWPGTECSGAFCCKDSVGWVCHPHLITTYKHTCVWKTTSRHQDF